MTKARATGLRALIGGSTAALALLTGLSAASADELSDLRANQQLLQQRIDQLAATINNNGAPQQQAALTPGPVVAGAPSIAGSFPRSFLIPGTNTSIAITGYVKYDAEEFITGGTNTITNGSSDNFGVSSVASLPLNLKGPTGSVTAAPFYNTAKQQHWIFKDTAAESRIRFETRTPSDWGQVTTVLEMDFEGCNSDTAICSNLSDGTFASLGRVRLAYATLGGFLAGQAFIPVNDTDAHPELFDFAGDAGQFGFSRAPWIGYTWQLPYGVSAQAAAVTPATLIATPIGGISNGCNPGTGLTGQSTCVAGSPGGFAVQPGKSNLPDANFVLRAEQPWGHVQGGFVLQRETLQDGAFVNQNFAGFGGGVSGSVRPNWFGFSSKDNFGFNLYAGNGLGHYANPPGNGEPTTTQGLETNWGLVGTACVLSTGVGCYGNSAGGGNTLTNARLVSTSTVPQQGFEVNYQHWWLDNLRSTASGGWQGQWFSLNLLGRNAVTLSYNKELWTAHANIIWSPISFIDTGFEYSFGERLTLLNQRGMMNVVDYSFKVKF
jgi:hypothetical protein